MSFDSEDVVDVAFPSRDAIAARVDWRGYRCVGDFAGADWRDTTGDHRWRSLDPLFVPSAKPLTQEWR